MVTWKTARATVALLGVTALAGIGGPAANALAATDAVTIAPAANPTLLEPTTVDVDGTAAAAGERLQVWITLDSSYLCSSGPNVPDTTPIWLDQDHALTSGTFHRTLPYTLGGVVGWSNYRVCAWVQTDPSAHSPGLDAYDEADLRGGQPAGTVAIALNAPARKTVATSVTLTGSTDVQRVLYAATTSTTSCGSDWLQDTSRGYGEPIGSPAGTTVGPGPFSVELPWTPDTTLPTGICAFLQGPQGASATDLTPIAAQLPVSVADVPPPPAPPAFALTAPADGASGTLLSPSFAWPAPKGARHFPPLDTFTLDSVQGARLVPLLKVTNSGASLESPKTVSSLLEIAGKKPTLPVASVGRLTIANGQVVFQLRSGLAPGAYEWDVTRSDERAAARRFTVVGQQLGKVTVKAKTTRLGAISDAAQTVWKLVGLPYGHVAMTVRLGGKARVKRFDLDRTGRTRSTSDWSCNEAGRVVKWTFAVRDDFGKTTTRSGSFLDVPRRYCQGLIHEKKLADAQARRHREAENRKREQDFAQWLAELRRGCKAIGGVLEDADGGRYVCVGPGGVRLLVPGFDY